MKDTLSHPISLLKLHVRGNQSTLKNLKYMQSQNALGSVVDMYTVPLVEKPMPSFGVRATNTCLLYCHFKSFLVVSILKLCFCINSSLVRTASSYSCKWSRNMCCHVYTKALLFFRSGIW